MHGGAGRFCEERNEEEVDEVYEGQPVVPEHACCKGRRERGEERRGEERRARMTPSACLSLISLSHISSADITLTDINKLHDPCLYSSSESCPVVPIHSKRH